MLRQVPGLGMPGKLGQACMGLQQLLYYGPFIDSADDYYQRARLSARQNPLV
jgi:hypothetical protein